MLPAAAQQRTTSATAAATTSNQQQRRPAQQQQRRPATSSEFVFVKLIVPVPAPIQALTITVTLGHLPSVCEQRVMASLIHLPSATSAVTSRHARHKQLQLVKTQKVPSRKTFPCMSRKPFSICCSKQPPWEPAPVTYASSDNVEDKFLEGTTNIFETMSSSKPAESSLTEAEGLTDVESQPPLQLQYLQWPVWLLGPAILLATGMVPTLWLPISSVFIGPNIANLLSLTGLDGW